MTVRYRARSITNIACNKIIPWSEIQIMSVTTFPPQRHQFLSIRLSGGKGFLASLSPRALLTARRQQRHLGIPTDAPLFIVVPFAVLQTGRDDLMAQLYAHAQAHGVGEKVQPYDPVHIEMPLPPPNP